MQKQDGFENGNIGESERIINLMSTLFILSLFNVPRCEECFESEQILNGHKCFPARSGKIPSKLKRYNYKTIVKKSWLSLNVLG